MGKSISTAIPYKGASMKIVKGTLADLDAVRMIALQWKATCNNKTMGMDIVDDTYMADVANLVKGVDRDLLLLTKEDDGEIVGYMGIVMFNSPLGSNKVASEHFWYVSEEHRGKGSMRLIQAAREWAKEKGCSHLMMTASTLASDLHDRVCMLYERIGFKKFETVYVQEIK